MPVSRRTVLEQPLCPFAIPCHRVVKEQAKVHSLGTAKSLGFPFCVALLVTLDVFCCSRRFLAPRLTSVA